MTALDTAFLAAQAAYQHDPTYGAVVSWFRALRAARRADEAIALMMT